MNYKVTFIFTPQPEGGYTVTCKELPGLVTEGDSVDEALANLKDAFAATLELYEDLGRPLPEGIQVPDEEVSIGNMPLQLETVLPGLEPTLPGGPA